MAEFIRITADEAAPPWDVRRVFNRLANDESEMFAGIYDPGNVSKDFMNGVRFAMKYLAAMIDIDFANVADEVFVSNMELSEEIGGNRA